MKDEKKPVKILIRYYSDVLQETTAEAMWATAVDEEKGLYKIDNIPFFGPLLAPGDIVFAEYDESASMLTYRETKEFSGNSVIHVVLINDEIEINDTRKIFDDMGCDSERMDDKYFVMEVPAEIDYKVIKKELDKLGSKGLIDYAEPCLSEIHTG